MILEPRLHLVVAALSFALVACGGGGGVGSTPAPVAPPAPAPTPTPTPTPPPTPSPTPTPTSAFQTSEYNRSTGPAQHGAVTAWSAGVTGQGVKIGIVDTGIDQTSPEFAGRIDPASRDVAGSRPLTNPDSDHGTNVAMVAAAARDNTGILGIAFNSTIVAFRGDTPGTCADPDPDKGCTFSDSSIATGVNAAVAAGAKVINLSLGGSPPNSILRAAIVNATNNGVVVVVSAGNDGDSTDPAVDPNNPDPMAAGLFAAGNGNVIIAGSVNASNVISDFSNKAGTTTAASAFLAARGERVCCTYENGQLKVVTNADGSRSVYVFSGTSFSAPQIAGAVALLREAFPNLTAPQVVDLLLRSATDAGAPGTDALYGRGILNITNAFAPQGTTSLAGSKVAVPLGDTTLVTSPPMGDAKGKAAGLSAIVLDGYDRAYQYNLGALIRGAEVQPRLAPAIANEVRSVTTGTDRVSLAFSVDNQGRISRLPWQGALSTGASDARASRVLAGRVIAQLSPRERAAFGFSQGADGLLSQIQGREGPGFLIARAPGDNPGFGQENLLSFAWRHQAGRWGLALSAEHGTAITAAPAWTAATQLDRRKYEAADRFGLSFDRTAGQWHFVAGASWLDEQRTVLGARFADSFAGGGADSLFVDLGTSWRPGERWRLGAQVRGGVTYPRASGAAIDGGRLLTSAWSVDATRLGVFGASDSLSLRVAQPLRVESGGISLNLPVAYSYATLQPTFASSLLDLTPRGREIDTELNWRSPLWTGSAMVSLYYRTDPGHYASMPDDQGVAVSWSKRF